nr:hypothetical protein [Anaerolineae bacterium]
MNDSSRTASNILASVLRTLAAISRQVADRFDTVVDFAYVRVLGVPFIVLGYRQTGKTTLINWLKRDKEFLAGFEPEPTAAGGESVPAFTTRLSADGSGMKLKPRRDVGGEYAMWETDWVELFQQTKPRGILFLIDHQNAYQHKDALNFVLQMLDDEESARKHLEMVMILVNKSDLWADEQSLDDLLDNFRNETRRLKSQAERLGYHHEIRQTSLVTEEGVREAMTAFFDAIRPRSQGLPESSDPPPEVKAGANGHKR